MPKFDFQSQFSMSNIIGGRKMNEEQIYEDVGKTEILSFLIIV